MTCGIHVIAKLSGTATERFWEFLVRWVRTPGSVSSRKGALSRNVAVWVHYNMGGIGLRSWASSITHVLSSFSLLKKLRCLSLRAIRPRDRRLSAMLVATFADWECRVVSATDPHEHHLGFIDRSRCCFFQVDLRRKNCNPILFAICTSTISKLCKNVYSGM
jgi:hypothetical protein